MAPRFKFQPTLRSSRASAANGMSSVLRLAARGRLTRAASPSWFDGLKQALRAAGPAIGARPLHALLCDFSPDERRAGR